MAQTHDPEAIRKETRTYIGVFVALAVLTILTVAVSYFHLPAVLAIAVALLIATFKGSLVAGFFMHLLHERKLIYWLLLLTVLFFLVLLFYPTISHWDQRHI
jgi:cytochrome c oxidase subunit IV